MNTCVPGASLEARSGSFSICRAVISRERLERKAWTWSDIGHLPGWLGWTADNARLEGTRGVKIRQRKYGYDAGACKNVVSGVSNGADEQLTGQPILAPAWPRATYGPKGTLHDLVWNQATDTAAAF